MTLSVEGEVGEGRADGLRTRRRARDERLRQRRGEWPELISQPLGLISPHYMHSAEAGIEGGWNR